MSEFSRTQKIPRLSPNTLSDTERWQALVNRDITANTFVYAVITTRIYCRPSCPARLARRANVQFYNTPSQAEIAGFRPCKRCRPHSGQTAAQSNPQTALVEKACASIRDILTVGLKPKPKELAVQAGLTPSHFHRVFKKHVGVTPGQYIDCVAQNSLHSPASLPPDAFGTETPCPSSGDGVGEILVFDKTSGKEARPSVAGVDLPGYADVWNQFDTLLASEQAYRPDSIFIDPRMILGSDVSIQLQD